MTNPYRLCGVVFASLLGVSISVLATEPSAAKVTEAQANLLYMKGRQLVLEGEYDKAIPLLEKAISGDPENAYINHQLGELYLRTGKLERAEALARKSVEKEPENVEYLATLGGVLAATNQYDEAKKQYAKISEIDPSNPKSVLLIGILEAEAGDMEGGIKTLTKAIRENEDSFMAYFYRAKIYLEMDNIRAAKQDLAKCQAIRPAFVEAGTALGLLHERQGEEDEAIKAYSQIRGNGRFRKRLAQLYLQKNEFEKALAELLEYEQLESDDYSTKVKVGLLLFELKKFEEAQERFEAILKEQPEADNVRFYLAAVHEEMRQWDKALTHFKKVSQDSSFHKEAMLHTGFIFRQQGKFSEGVSFAKRLQKQFPGVAEYYDMHASFLEGQKKFKEALQVLEAGLEKFPADEKLAYFQGAMFERLGDRKKAIERMKSLVESNPKNAHALNFIGYTYSEMGENLEQAEEYVRKAHALRPSDGFIEDSLGWVLFKRGKVEDALTHLLKAAELQPEEAVIWEHLGDVYEHKQAFTKAAEAYEKARSLSQGKDREMVKKLESKMANLPEEHRSPSNLKRSKP